MIHDTPRMGDLNELVERFASIAAAESDHDYHRSVMSVYGELPKGQLYVDAGALSAALTSLIAERDGLREALSGLLRGEYESAEPGLCDCVDNHGKPYQSQFLADRIAAAEATLSLDTNKGDGV